MKKIIVYDFDKTLTCEDTLFGFFRFSSDKNIWYPFKIIIYVACMVLTKFNFISNESLKLAGVHIFLRKVDSNMLRLRSNFYHKKIEFNKIFKELNFDQDIDYVVVSASFEDYLRPIFPNFVRIVGSKLDYSQVNGFFLKFNCYGENKVKALAMHNIACIDTLYTDSINDLPLAKISKRIILIRKDKKIYCNDLDDFINKTSS
jgi:hypothetical protein